MASSISSQELRSDEAILGSGTIHECLPNSMHAPCPAFRAFPSSGFGFCSSLTISRFCSHCSLWPECPSSPSRQSQHFNSSRPSRPSQMHPSPETSLDSFSWKWRLPPEFPQSLVHTSLRARSTTLPAVGVGCDPPQHPATSGSSHPLFLGKVSIV